MPEQPDWCAPSEILTFEELERLGRLLVSAGITKLRLTGGEPTTRKDLPVLVRKLAALPGLEDLSLTTNGYLLERIGMALREAGLRRINVSLDTLCPETFRRLARRDALARVLAGIREADRLGFSPLKINTVVLRGVNDHEVADFARLARGGPFRVRFIEFMPLGGVGTWSREQVVPAREILDRIRAEVGPLDPAADQAPTDPARIFRFRDGIGDIGIISSVTEPFCSACDRIRITAEGKLRTCLFSHGETDLRKPLRGGSSDEEIVDLIRRATWEKEAGHGINAPGFLQPSRPMHAIGG